MNRTITPANQESTLCRNLLLSGNLISIRDFRDIIRRLITEGGSRQKQYIIHVIYEMSALM